MWDIPDKVANNGVSLAGKHMHSEFNNRQHEIEKVVTSTGIALTAYPTDPNATSDTDETMLAQSISRLASLGTAAADSGVANAFVLSALGAVVAPKALFDSMTVVTIPSATNTGASTANVFGLGVKAIRSYSDTALTGGEIVSGRPTAWRYSTAANSGAGAWLILPWANAKSVASDAVFNISSQVYSAAGTYAFTVPAGVTRLRGRVWGGGGGGGPTTANALGGSGGNGGGFAEGYFAVTPGQTITVTVGAAGTAGVAPSGVGGNGGTTSIGAFVSATGGQGGNYGSASYPGYTPNTVGTGGGTAATLTISGSRGGQGGGPANGYGAIGGFGGSSPMGGGNCPGTTGAANVGQSPGGGGSGGGGYTGSNCNGGLGAPGQAIIEWVNP